MLQCYSYIHVINTMSYYYKYCPSLQMPYMRSPTFLTPKVCWNFQTSWGSRSCSNTSPLFPRVVILHFCGQSPRSECSSNGNQISHPRIPATSISAYCPDPRHHPILFTALLKREGTHNTTQIHRPALISWCRCLCSYSGAPSHPLGPVSPDLSAVWKQISSQFGFLFFAPLCTSCIVVLRLRWIFPFFFNVTIVCVCVHECQTTCISTVHCSVLIVQLSSTT